MQKTTASKPCSKCGEVKALDQFHKRSDTASGYRSHCKACVRKQNRGWHYANPAKSSAQSREWAKSNPDRVKTIAKRWRDNNPDKLREIEARRWERRSTRVQRILRLVEHFAGRVGRLHVVAEIVGNRGDVASVSYVSPRIDEFLLTYYYKEA